jgi:hypothetical protein
MGVLYPKGKEGLRKLTFHFHAICHLNGFEEAKQKLMDKVILRPPISAYLSLKKHWLQER